MASFGDAIATLVVPEATIIGVILAAALFGTLSAVALISMARRVRARITLFRRRHPGTDDSGQDRSE